MVDLRGAEGSEQAGVRPAVILQNDAGNRHAPTTIIAPVTRKASRLPCHVRIEHPALPTASTVMLEQVRTVALHRIVHWIGGLTEEQMNALDGGLRVSLGLAEIPTKMAV